MSASGYKRTYSGQLANVRFTPESGHPDAPNRSGLKKRTFNVCFAPESGHKWLCRWMSAFDPKRTLRVMLDVGKSKRRLNHGIAIRHWSLAMLVYPPRITPWRLRR